MALRTGLIGFGTVGTGAVRTLLENRDHIHLRAGTKSKWQESRIWTGKRTGARSAVQREEEQGRLGTDPGPNIDVIIELVGGTTIARDFVSALESGKDVVTANKRHYWHIKAGIYSKSPVNRGARFILKPPWAAGFQ